MARLKEAEKEVAALRQSQLLARAAALVDSAVDAAGVRVVTADAGEVAGADDLRVLALDVRSRLGDSAPAAVAVLGVANGRPLVVVATNAGARDAGVRAGALVKVATAVLGGGGGGKDDVAQGGGTKVEAGADALSAIVSAVESRG